MIKKPMLAATLEDVESLNYHYGFLVSPKLDGVRCIIDKAVALSRSMKPIRNEYVQFLFGRSEYNGMDGELIVGDPTARDCYRVTMSGVMSLDGKPDVRLYAFDRFDMAAPFHERLRSLPTDDGRVVPLTHTFVQDKGHLLDLEAGYLSQGYEGVMLRDPNGPYKHGRSTLKERTLLKLKRFVDEEFQVIGFEERMHNANEAKINELGHTERSMHRENMIGRGDLGALILRRDSDGAEFTCGSGFTDADRRHIWDNRRLYLGMWAKVKHFPIGVKDLPRFPVWLGFRDSEDML